MAVSKIEVTNHHHLHILVHLHHHHYVHHIHPPPLSPPWSPSSPSSLSWFMVSFVYLVARCVIEAVSRCNHLILKDLSVPTHSCILSNVRLSPYSAQPNCIFTNFFYTQTKKIQYPPSCILTNFFYTESFLPSCQRWEFPHILLGLTHQLPEMFSLMLWNSLLLSG